MPWPSFTEVVDTVHWHILLRAAIGLDRQNTLHRHGMLIKEMEAVFGGDFIPARAFAAITLPNEHPLRLAIAYDLWRLGDYQASKQFLISALGFEPFAPPCTLS